MLQKCLVCIENRRRLRDTSFLNHWGTLPSLPVAVATESSLPRSFNFFLSPTGLNYRKLTDESSDPLATLRPVLTSQNVLSISKLAHRLPVPGGSGATMSASGVHAIWLQKLFWEGDPQLLKRPPQSDQDYLHAYDTCAKYLDRLTPANAVHFLDAITFSADAAKHVSLQV